jgi:hypothetical protein
MNVKGKRVDIQKFELSEIIVIIIIIIIIRAWRWPLTPI